MMYRLLYLAVFFVFTSSLVLLTGCSESNEPELETSDLATLNSFSAVDSDLEILEKGGVTFEKGIGLFSIGWNQIFRHMVFQEDVTGHAFAIGFEKPQDEKPRPFVGGIDMGSVYINYNSSKLELQKVQGPIGGILYALFRLPFFGFFNGLEYVPNAIYEFEVTGSDKFSPVKMELRSPPGLLNITSHEPWQDVDVEQALSLKWEGGGKEAPVIIRVVVLQKPEDGDDHGHGSGTGVRFDHPHPPRFFEIIVEVLDNNPGEYTLTAETLQELVTDSEAMGLIFSVSQWSVEKAAHDNGFLMAVMRNGDKIHLGIE
jgi:hypothetical protein